MSRQAAGGGKGGGGKSEAGGGRGSAAVPFAPVSPAASASSSALASLFECPVCFDYVLPPILQCQNGHLVCSSCRQKLTCCPTCRGPIGGAPIGEGGGAVGTAAGSTVGALPSVGGAVWASGLQLSPGITTYSVTALIQIFGNNILICNVGS